MNSVRRYMHPWVNPSISRHNGQKRGESLKIITSDEGNPW